MERMELVVKIVVGRKNESGPTNTRNGARTGVQMRVQLLFQFSKGAAAKSLKGLDHKTMGA